MRSLAEFVMKGRNQAILTGVIAATVPLMFWLAATVVGLVTLRKGATVGLGVWGFVLIPALFWMGYLGEPTPLVVMVTAFVMTVILRNTVSWEKMLISGVLTAAASVSCVTFLLTGFVDQLTEAGKTLLTTVEPDLVKQLGQEAFEQTTRNVMLGSLTASYLIFSLVAVLLARSWQAKLYNPGGFQKEFHGFRLSKPFSLIGAAVMLLALYTEGGAGMAILVMPVPFALAGLALVHGVIAKKSMGGAWLFWFYALAFIMGPSLIILLVFLAITDSLVDFRGRIVDAG